MLGEGQSSHLVRRGCDTPEGFTTSHAPEAIDNTFGHCIRASINDGMENSGQGRYSLPEELHRYVLDHPRDPLPDMSSDAGSSHTYERQSSQRHSYSPTPHPPSLTPATFPREDSTEPGPSSHPPSEWSSTDEARTSSWRSHEGREATHPLEGRWSAEEGYGLTPPHRSHEFQTSTLCEAIFTRLSNLPGLMDSQGELFLTALQRGQETDAGLITSW